MRLSSGKAKIRPENWRLQGTFKGYPIEIDIGLFGEEFHQILTSMNDYSEKVLQAVNANEGSAITVEGTVVGDLPDPEKAIQGKIFQLYDPTGGTTDTGWVCVWNTGAAAYQWLSIY